MVGCASPRLKRYMIKVSRVERDDGTGLSPLGSVNLRKDFHLLRYRQEVDGFLAWFKTAQNSGLSFMPSDVGIGHQDGGLPHRSGRGETVSEVSGTVLVLSLSDGRTTVFATTMGR